MADEEHLEIIRQGVKTWNEWRQNNRELIPCLSGADLSGADLSGADLSGAYLFGIKLSGANLSEANLSNAELRWANLSWATLRKANLEGADLSEAYLHEANLNWAYLSEANLSKANLHRANLHRATLSKANLSKANLGDAELIHADLSGANLTEVDLSETLLIGTDLRGASLAGSSVYGASVWHIKVNDQTNQQNLIITPNGEAAITVDNIKVAQFIYLLLKNQEIRDVIDTITAKAVLILGRFSEERKPVLDAMRDALRNHDYLPILFDFPPSANQATLETIKTLASMARFVVADLTDARSVLLELGAIVPAFPSVAVRLLIKKSEHEYGMLDYIRRYRSVVEDTYEYENLQEVITSIKENVIAPAEAKVKELRKTN